MRALERKLLRDVRRLGGQVLTIALVLGSGVGFYLVSEGMSVSLAALQREWYDLAADRLDLLAVLKARE